MAKTSTKYIVVSGGVFSGVGKGLTVASLSLLLKQRGLSVTCIKFDGYGNSNASCINPREHGELFIGDDGCETDLDLGSYERIGLVQVGKNNICTSGLIHYELLVAQDNELLGKTIQIVPHFTQHVIDKIHKVAEGHDICIVELGGCVGDIESAGFYEAIRQFKQMHRDNCLVGMLAPIFWINSIKEFKTKPIQRAVKDLQSHGLQPEFLFCRCDRQIPEKILDKVSYMTSVSRDAVFDLPDVNNVYSIPIEFYNRKIDCFFVDMFNLKRSTCKIHKYRELVEKPLERSVTIGVVGKYENTEEAYVSVKHALYHAGVANSSKVNINWISAEDLEGNLEKEWEVLRQCHGIIVPGGFDKRGVEGKISAISYARTRSIPFLGICLGLQCAVIEIARNVVGITDANSEEFDPNCPNKVVHYMEGQKGIQKKSGTMRLGAYDCDLEKDTLAKEWYRKKSISERHRHRFEVNNEYEEYLRDKGFKVSGRNLVGNHIEIMELDSKIHPYFIGTQFHGEFKSTLFVPHPLFCGLVYHALNSTQ